MNSEGVNELKVPFFTALTSSLIATLVYPLDLINTRIKTDLEPKSIVKTLKEITREGGVS